MTTVSCIDERLKELVVAKLQDLYNVQTRPFVHIIPEYMHSVQHCREQEVRLGQLDKEGAELRDENADLHRRLQHLDELIAQDYAAKAAHLAEELQKAQAELSSLYKDKARNLEELLAATNQVQTLQSDNKQLKEQLSKAHDELAFLQKRVVDLAEEASNERAAGAVASSELEVRLADKEAAEERAEMLAAENARLLAQVMDAKEKEAEHMNEIARIHEDAMENARRLMTEAAAQREAADLMRDKAAGGSTLKQAMGLPEGRVEGRDRGLPKEPYKSHPGSHKGGATSLAVACTGNGATQSLVVGVSATALRAGQWVATCGVDRIVRGWDISSMEAVHLYSGMLATVNDVAYNCDGRFVLGAGSDKSLRLWDTNTGQTRHTLTGHSNAVSCVACSPMDAGLAVSASEDRSLKLWDLVRGFSKRSIPCTKMPNTLCITRDGSTIVTGHLDGGLCLWDMRQCSGGTTRPFAEARELSAAAVACVTPTCTDSELLVAGRDNVVRVFDLRAMAASASYRAPQFQLATIGSMGRARCKVEESPDGRYIAAGGADNSVVVWDTAAANGSSTAVRQLRHHKDAVVACGWSLDGNTLVTADKAGAVAFWSLV